MTHRYTHATLALSLRGCALALLAVLGVACGAPSASAPAAEAPSTAAAATTLTYAFPDDAASSAAAQALIAAYTKARPGIQIVPQPLPAKDYAQQLLARLENNPPDMFVSLDTQAPALIKSGALLDIQPMLQGDNKLNLDDFQPLGIDPWQREGALYGLPSDLAPMVMFYNRDMFAAAGVAEPKPGWTWNDWLANAKKLTLTSGSDVSRFGTALMPWGAMVWGNGGDLISADGKRALLDSPEAAAGVQFAADMVNVHHVAPLPALAGGPDPVQLFKDQKVAMLPASSSTAGSLTQAKLPFSWAIAPFPSGKVAATSLSVSGLALSAKTKNAGAALQFATWAVGAEGQAATASALPFAVPAQRSAPARPSNVAGADMIARSVEFGRTLPQVAQWPAIANEVNTALVPVFEGKTTAALAYQKVAPKINALLTTG
jgi:multiple sugar transport system substrate-binding protein